MGGVVNTTKKAFHDTTSVFKTAVTHPSKLNFGDILTGSTAGGFSPLRQAYNTATKKTDGGGGTAGYTDNPAQTLAMTGGAPLLANVAMGADIKDALAGYFGASDYDSFYNGLDDSSKQLVDGIKNQLTEIQTNTNLRNEAVQKVVNDFPNIAVKAAQDRQAAGGEFDEATKGAMNLALNSVAAKAAMGGNLSSGATAEAMARVGAQQATDKLGYMNDRQNTSYNQGLQGWQARYNEVNALRNFQNIMTQGAAGNGFSAVQNALGRTQQTNMVNAGYSNMSKINSANNQNAMFGAIGQVGGTVIGGIYGGPVGAAAGGQVGKMAGDSLSNSNGSSFPQGSSTMSNPFSYPMSQPNARLNLGY